MCNTCKVICINVQDNGVKANFSFTRNRRFGTVAAAWRVLHQRKIIATINVRINAACLMIDRRRVMTPSAHGSNIRRAQLRGVVTNDPRGAAHLPPVSRRERRYFYLFAATPSRGSILLKLVARSRSMGCLCAKVRELFHSLNPSGAVANATALSPKDSSVPTTRDGFNTGRE